MNNLNVEIPFSLINDFMEHVECYLENQDENVIPIKGFILDDLYNIKQCLEPITNPEPIDLEEFKKTVDLEEFKKSVSSKEQKEWFENEINKFEDEVLKKD